MTITQSSDSNGVSIFGFIHLVLLTATARLPSSFYVSSNNKVSCYERGLIGGEDHPFSQSTYGKCGDDYYEGFLEGCISVDGNDMDVCERATDG